MSQKLPNMLENTISKIREMVDANSVVGEPITTPDGVKIFIWGNTLDRPDQRSILRELKPDIAILQITGRNPIDKVVDICKDMECKVLIPNHIDFPKDYTAIATELGEEMAKNAPEIRFIYPEYGKWIEL